MKRDGVLRGTPKKSAVDRNVIMLRIALLIVSLVMVTELWASGWPPFVRDDEIEVFRGGTATVLVGGARSVLANDFDIERDPLTAIVTRQPKHGELTLNPDGTFIYVHDGDKKDDDEFRYVAFDGTGSSREAKVRIEVEDVPNNPPFTTGSPPDQEAIEGAFFQLALAGYFGDIDEDDSLRFSASGLPGGNRLQIDPDSGMLSGTPNGSDVRDNPYNVRITATDRAGASASLEFRLTIFADSRADLNLSAEAVINPVTVGEAVQWNINVENRGPGDLDQGELVVDWASSGPTLSLTASQDCSLSDNNTSSPSMRCSITSLPAGNTFSIDVLANQSGAGDSSLLAVVSSDDPNPSNNSMVSGAVVVEAFSEGPTQVIDSAALDVASGDLNGDGLMDVVVAAAETVIYLNSGSRSLLTPGTSLGSDSRGNAVVMLDWNGDGILDIAVAGMDSLAGRVYLNDGIGQFSDTVDLNVSGMGTVLAVAAADFDSDGADDLVLAGTGNATLARSSSEVGFATSPLPATSGIDAAISDVNSDGLDDIIVVESGDRTVRIMRNSGDGRTFENQSLDQGSVAAATPQDMDRDGDIDLLLAVDDGELAVPESKILYQEPDGSFSIGANLGASPLSKMLSGDIDDDGVPDVVAINETGVHQLYRGLQSGGFALLPEQIVSNGMRRGVLIDFNSDDSLDLIFAGIDAGVVEIHANNGIGRLGLGDRVAPSITLIGESIVALASGDEYIEMGATATDDIDGDVTESIVINGSVNTTTIGTYTISYTASDKATNSGTVQRTVQVGVNEGTGGGGGGMAGPMFGGLLLLLATLRRRYRRK